MGYIDPGAVVKPEKEVLKAPKIESQ